jgi:heme O synthase-like polyprenyltransferase
MVSKNVLVGSIVTVLICLALSVTCAIIRSFDVVSVILLAVVVVLGIVIAVTAWREIVNQKHDEEVI